MGATQSIESGYPRDAAPSSPRRERLKLSKVLLHATIIFFCLIVVLPVAWVLLMSIKSIPDAYTGLLWPKQFDFTHYGYVFEKMPNVLQNFANSIIVTGGFGEWAWPRIAAVYVMAILPGILSFAIAQQWYMKGLSEGALKF